MADRTNRRLSLSRAKDSLKGYLPIQAYSISPYPYIGESGGENGVLYTLDDLVKDILEVQIEVARVVYIDEAAGIIRDASTEVANAVVAAADEPMVDECYDFCEAHASFLPGNLHPHYDNGPAYDAHQRMVRSQSPRVL